MEIQVYTPVVLAMVLAVGFCCLFWLLARVIGPRRLSAEKLAPFECGSDPIGSPRGRYSVKFYQVALLFLVFDIEAAFMYPWASIYGRPQTEGAFSLSTCSLDQVRDGLCPMAVQTSTGIISFFGFAEMSVFVLILFVALAYVWRKKAIGWD